MYKGTNRFMQHKSSVARNSNPLETLPLSEQIEEVKRGRMSRLHRLREQFEASGLSLLSASKSGRKVLVVEHGGQILEFTDVRQARTFLESLRRKRIQAL